MEFHLGNYNFCGPNTRLDDRLNHDGTPKEWSKPINKIDEICMRHDIGYHNAGEGHGTRCEADEVMLRELSALDNDDLTCNELFVKYFVMCIIGILYRLRLLRQ